MKIFTIVVLMSLFFSCKNDLDVNEDFKEVAIIYGLLDIADSVHYIRVERTYQNGSGKGALVVASEHDSIYFDTLEVKILEFDPQHKLISTKICSSDYTIKKDSGTFSSMPHIIYALKSKLNKDNSYQLKVTSSKGKEYTSSTSLVSGNSMRLLTSIQPPKYVFDLPLDNDEFTILIGAGNNSYMYDCLVRFYLTTYDSLSHDSFNDIL
ncbi:MAG: DUF4249 family protein, partial [Bacteroidetes bacterium]|nr:DUF4249 family protein [Bacteroidota bacterium]